MDIAQKAVGVDIGPNFPALAPFLDRIRMPTVLFLVLFGAAQHILMLHSPPEWRLSTMLVAYAVVIPSLGWAVLLGLARFAHRIERVQGERLQAVAALRRRTEQIEVLYSATRLLADAYAVEPLLNTLSGLAQRIAAAEGVGIHWQPDGDHPAALAVTGNIDRAVIEAYQPDGVVDSTLRYVSLSADGHALGWIAMSNPAWDAATRHSLELLAQEIGNLWRARRSERKAWAALSTIGRAVEDAEDLRVGASSVLTAMAKATAAVGASFYCRAPEGWRCRIETGRPANPPDQPDGADIWQDESQKAIYVASDADNVLALVFDRLPARFPNTRERQLLQAIGCQAGWLIQTTDAATRVLEHERGRIAAELHNGLSQTLAYLHLQVGHALALLREGRSETASSVLEELGDVALEAYQTIRGAVDDLCLHPAPWESPAAYLKRIAQTGTARNKLTLTFKDDHDGIAVQPRALRTLASVLQEAIANAASHGGAREIEIAVRSDSEGLSMRIADNGCGFARDDTRPGHYGLALMRERIQALGGQVTIDGGLGRGTVVALFVPASEALVQEALP